MRKIWKKLNSIFLIGVFSCSLSVPVYAGGIDLKGMTTAELDSLSTDIDNAIEQCHTPDKDRKETVLDFVKKNVESYASDQGIEKVDWAWIDYTYTRDWDLYAVDTHADFDDERVDIYAEVFPENGQDSLYYLLIGKDVIIDRRSDLPKHLWLKEPVSIINKAAGKDLSRMSLKNLNKLEKNIKKEIKAEHDPDSDITGIVLDLTKTKVEDYYKKQNLSVDWAWFDYDYSREWDFYTLATPISYETEDGEDKGDADVYAEAYPLNGEYELCYLSVDDQELINKRESLPEDISSISIEKENEIKSTQIKDNETEDNADQEGYKILTVDNCPDLQNILLEKGESSNKYIEFSQKYEDEVIEFNAYIANMQLHGDYDTRYDVLICYDNPDGSVTGPQFQFNDVGLVQIGGSDDPVKTGDRITVQAEVKDFDTDTLLFHLHPVKVEKN